MGDLFRAVQHAIVAAVQAPDFSFPLPDLVDYSWTQGMPNMRKLSYAEWERLAFLGDSAASGCIANQLKQLLPQGNTHLYSVLRSGLVSNQTFAHIYKKATLLAISSPDPVVVQPSLFKRGGDFFEAILGLMLQQKSLEFVRGWLEPMYKPLIRAAAQAYLSLQEYKLRLPPPGRGTVACGLPDHKIATEVSAIKGYLASTSARVPRPAPTQARPLKHQPGAEASHHALAVRDPNIHQSLSLSTSASQDPAQARKPAHHVPLPHKDVDVSHSGVELIDLCGDNDLSDMDISSPLKANIGEVRVLSPDSSLAPRSRPRSLSSASIESYDGSGWIPPTRERGARARSPQSAPRGRDPTIHHQDASRAMATRRDSPPQPAVASYPVDNDLQDPFARLSLQPHAHSPPRVASYPDYNDQAQDASAWPPPPIPHMPLERRLRSPSVPARHPDFYRDEPRQQGSRPRYSDNEVRRRVRTPSPPRRFRTPSPDPSRYIPLEKRIRTPPPRRREAYDPPLPSRHYESFAERPALARRLRSPSPPPLYRAYEPREQSPRMARYEMQQERRYRYDYEYDYTRQPPSRIYY
ncbi:hypothetical protein OE88DRAFT_1658775 [Heliocybe sulcata]|uniref:RNase III domain-containing protein n=1 Tax=Heliocybe sulcata TaxID=5364 RepID=A0A5C3N691_9AGAM|nr:hypothetical protein OE88DRAFT_1658775 [Heliocybe sulcata]